MQASNAGKVINSRQRANLSLLGKPPLPRRAHILWYACLAGCAEATIHTPHAINLSYYTTANSSEIWE